MESQMLEREIEPALIEIIAMHVKSYSEAAWKLTKYPAGVQWHHSRNLQQSSALVLSIAFNRQNAFSPESQVA
jgi:hypothetical protein